MIFFAISQSFQKVRVNNKASLYTILYTNRFLHTQITQRETIIKMSTITTTRSLLSSASLRGSAVSSSEFYVTNLFLIIFRNPRAVTFPREALFFSILTNSFLPPKHLLAGALNLNARATIQTIQEYYFVRSDEIAFVFVVLSSRFFNR